MFKNMLDLFEYLKVLVLVNELVLILLIMNRLASSLKRIHKHKTFKDIVQRG